MNRNYPVWTIALALLMASTFAPPVVAENVVISQTVPKTFPANLEDATIMFTNTEINVGQIDKTKLAPFTDFKVFNDDKSIMLTGGNIAPGTAVELTIPTQVDFGSKYRYVDWSFVGGGKRANSPNDDIFSTAVPGGASGTSFAGVSIPANQYGYFYEFDRNSNFLQSPDTFSVFTGNSAPTSSGVLANSWLASDLESDLPSNLSSGDIAAVADSMVPALLTGNPGVSPLSWSFLDDQITATFGANAFNIGDVSDALWFTSPLPPELGGPLGLGADNVSISAGGTLLFTNSTLAPAVPEPSSLKLLASAALLAVACFKRRRGHRGA